MNKMLNRFLLASNALFVAATLVASTENADDLVSGGFEAHSASAAPAANSTGFGLTVGVIAPPISQTKLELLQSLSIDQLPASITVLPGGARDDADSDAFQGSDVGLDVLQIIHDMAPDASLVFVAPQDWGGEDAPATEAEAFQAALNALVAHNVDEVDIIVDVYELSETDEAVFWDDELARAVESVADDLIYVIASGDEGNRLATTSYVSSNVYEGAFVPTTVPATVNLGTGFEYVESAHNFDGSGDTLLTINQPLKRLCLHWADQPDDSYNDYELFVIGDDPNTTETEKVVLAKSTDFQYLGATNEMGDPAPPRECIPNPLDATGAGAAALVPGNEILIGTDAIAAQGRYLHLRAELTDEAENTLSSGAMATLQKAISNPPAVLEITTPGSIRGRAGLPNVITVASAPIMEDYVGNPRPFRSGDPSGGLQADAASTSTSVGNRAVFWRRDEADSAWIPVGGDDPNLNPVNPSLPGSGAEVRLKPDVVGADGVRVYRVVGSPSERRALRGEPAIIGSRAGAAHVGGLLARILEGQGIHKPEIVDALLEKAVDLGLNGVDVRSGHGAPHAANTLTQVALPLPPVDLRVIVGNGSATLTFSAPPDDAGDTYAYTASCFYSNSSVSDEALFEDRSVATDGYSFAVLPNSTVRCEVTAIDGVAEQNPVAEATTGTNTVTPLDPPVIDRIDSEPFGFTVRYTVDGVGIPGITFGNTISCFETSSENPRTYVIGDNEAGVLLPPSPAVFDDQDGPIQNDVELECTADFKTFINASTEPGADNVPIESGSGALTFSVTPENTSGLPIWLLYEATKDTQLP